MQSHQIEAGGLQGAPGQTGMVKSSEVSLNLLLRRCCGIGHWSQCNDWFTKAMGKKLWDTPLGDIFARVRQLAPDPPARKLLSTASDVYCCLHRDRLKERARARDANLKGKALEAALKMAIQSSMACQRRRSRV